MAPVLVLVDLWWSYGRRVLEGVTRYAREVGGWRVAPMPAHEEYWVGAPWRGMIFQFNPSFEGRMARVGCPRVNVGDLVREGPERHATVISDNQTIGGVMAEHLCDRGFRRLIYCGQKGAYYSEQRWAGFEGQGRDRGAECVLLELNPCDAWEGGVAEALRGTRRPVGVAGCNDAWARAMIDLCQARGLSVPTEVAVVGVDDDPLIAERSRPILSSVAPAAEQIGYEAAAMLDGLIRGQPSPRSPLLIRPGGMRVRESSDTWAIDDPVVRGAIRYIHSHLDRPMRVDDLLRDGIACRRTLERRFQQAIGRGPAEEIRRLKVERAKQLLSSTALPLAAIAAGCGLMTTALLTRVFLNQTGLTPLQYRDRQQWTAVPRIGAGLHR